MWAYVRGRDKRDSRGVWRQGPRCVRLGGNDQGIAIFGLLCAAMSELIGSVVRTPPPRGALEVRSERKTGHVAAESPSTSRSCVGVWVRMVGEVRPDHPAEKPGIGTAETSRTWVRRPRPTLESPRPCGRSCGNVSAAGQIQRPVTDHPGRFALSEGRQPRLLNPRDACHC